MSNEPAIASLPEGVREGNERLIYLTSAAGAKNQCFSGAGAGGGILAGEDNWGRLQRPELQDALCRGSEARRHHRRLAGARVVTDSKSALYLRGTELDYSDKMVGGGFKFSNPNAKASCSCGESFSI